MPICVGRSKATERPVMPCESRIAVAPVALLGRAEAGVLAHGPEPLAVHVRMNAPRVRVLPRKFVRRAHEREILRAVEKM